MKGVFMMLQIVVLLASSFGSPGVEAESPPSIRWEPYSATGSDRQPIEGELGRITVPENRGLTDGAKIEIAFVRFRTKDPKPGPSIVYFAGGPGASGVEYCVRPATGRMLRLLDHHDVIGIDQRGTGLSRPNLEEGGPFTWELPLDRPVTRDEVITAWTKAVERSAAYWKERGVDLASYHTEASADDADDVRRALGIEKVITWGESYGTHLSIAYLRRHGAHVDRSAMFRVEGPDQTWKYPSTTQRHLERLGALVAADPGFAEELPDLVGTVKSLLAKLVKEPAILATSASDASPITVGPLDFQIWLAGRLGLAFEFRDVPAAILRMSSGDWSDLREVAFECRRGEIGSAMAFAMDCASGGSATRLARIELEQKDPLNLLSDAVNGPYPGACSGCGKSRLSDEFHRPFRCEVPVLFVSGDLDARTPPENVEEIRAWFPNHAHVIAQNAGHESIEMLSAEFRALLLAFLRGEKVESQVVELPEPRFRR